MVVDWDSKPEPWRSIGHEWVRQLNRLMAGYQRPPEPVERSMHPGVILRDLRRGRGLSIRVFAAMTGYDRKTIERLELGHTKRAGEAIKADIAQALGVAVTDIWPD